MAALIGLFLGALAGNLVWHEWGAALGGIAGFFAGVRFSAWRGRAAPGRSAIGTDVSAAPAPAARAGTRQETEGALARRVIELELRVASLERRAGIGPEPAAAQVPSAIMVPEAAAPAQGVAAAAAGTESDRAVDLPTGEGKIRSRDFEMAETPALPAIQGCRRHACACSAVARESVAGMARRRQRADAHRCRHTVLWRRVPAQVFHRAFHHADRTAARHGCRRRIRADGARHAPRGFAPGLRPLIAGRRSRHTLSDGLRGISPLWRAARGAGGRAAHRGFGAYGLACRAQRFAAARGPGHRRRIFGPRAGGQRRRPRAAVRLFRAAERRDLHARVVEGMAGAQCGGLRVHVRARARLGPRVLPCGTLRDRAAVPGAVLRLLRRHRDSLRAARAPRRTRSGGRSPCVRRSAGRVRIAGRARARFRIRRGMERARAGDRLCAAFPGPAPAPRTRFSAAVARVPRAGRHLRDHRHPVRARQSLDGRILGDRGGRRLLDRREAEARGLPGRSRWPSKVEQRSCSSPPVSAQPTTRCSPMRFSPGRC